MNLHWIDWTLVALIMAGVTFVAVATKKYLRSVADFLAANRCAGRYLLCVAGGMANLGAISIIAGFEMYYAVGFTAAWWVELMTPVGLFIVVSGWVMYRYRETRSLTIAQFFEIRYSKRLRIYAGALAWFSGIVNFGIFPAVGTRFFMHFCGLPETIPGTDLSTYVVVMVGLLSVSLFFVFLGGQIAVMITDFVQGVIGNIAFLAVLVVIFLTVDWSTLIETLKSTAPADASMINPMHGTKIKNFNMFFYLIAATGAIYAAGAWQGSQGYFCSARTAHEAKMAGILGTWRGLILILLLMMLPIGAYAIMNNPAFAAVAGDVTGQLDRIDSDTVRSQMTVPIVLSRILPVGVAGLFCAAMLCAFISTHDTYLHSWGSIFIQDVIIPLRKKPLTPRQHMLALRLSILFVALFIFVFSLFFRQNQYILMFFAITGAIYAGGAGSLIVGGLYWKRGAASGAWAALTIGLFMGIGGLVARQTWAPILYPWMLEYTPGFLESLRSLLDGISGRAPGLNWHVVPEEFPFNSQWIYFSTMVLAALSYVGCSLFEAFVLKRPAFNMDRLLHRGTYAIEGEHAGGVVKPVTGFRAVMPTDEYTRGDRIIYWGKMTWTLGWFGIFLFGTFYALTHEVSDDAWASFWGWKVVITVLVGAGTTIWFMIGGIIDMKDLFKTLATAKRDVLDNGSVVDHHLPTDGEVTPRSGRTDST